MQTCSLADTGRTTTRLGYGCSSIMGGMGRRESLRVLEWAFDTGVRHFDVAPMYGYGEAEACLGEFIAHHRGEVTVTTKYGIPPAARSTMRNVVRSVASPLLKAVPALKAKAQRAARPSGPAPPRELSAAAAEASLENSLRALRVERIDCLLLHDATPAEVRDDSLLAFLQRAREQGRIGAFGVGTDREHAIAIEQQSPAYAQVVQREWSVFDDLEQGGAFRIYHRSLGENFRRLQSFLKRSPEQAQAWSGEVGADLSAPGVLSSLMMRAALWASPAGILLFSSKVREHIQANAALASSSSFENGRAEALYRLVQRERGSIVQEDAA